ncbi:hypothetical protein J6590_029241 [Homalodisca vitripennis]|nr:hypothetical protein J6590_029241 [Homalodisca vitripennis]
MSSEAWNRCESVAPYGMSNILTRIVVVLGRAGTYRLCSVCPNGLHKDPMKFSKIDSGFEGTQPATLTQNRSPTVLSLPNQSARYMAPCAVLSQTRLAVGATQLSLPGLSPRDVPVSCPCPTRDVGVRPHVCTDLTDRHSTSSVAAAWMTAERSCPCKQPACPAIGGGSEVTFEPLIPRAASLESDAVTDLTPEIYNHVRLKRSTHKVLRQENSVAPPCLEIVSILS